MNIGSFRKVGSASGMEVHFNIAVGAAGFGKTYSKKFHVLVGSSSCAATFSALNRS